MGWKSTVDIKREEAISIIENVDLNELSDEVLEEVVEAIMGGENHGHNYMIID